MKDRYFNLVDLIDARRRERGVVQTFPTKEALQEYTMSTASYFPYRHLKAGNLLRQLLSRKPHLNTTRNVSKSRFFPPPYAQEQRAKAKAKARDNMLPISRKSKKPHRTMAETIDASNAYPYDDFESV